MQENKWHFDPEFSPYLFWDRDVTKIDFQRHAPFVIQRVFEMGRLNDLTELTTYYGRKQVIDVLTSCVSLRENALNLAIVIFKLSKEQFLCSTLQPSPRRF